MQPHAPELPPVHEACGSAEPALDTVAYTLGAGPGPELVATTSAAPGSSPDVHVGMAELRTCLTRWTEHREQGRQPAAVTLYDGLVTVMPTDRRTREVGDVQDERDVHLCLLDEPDRVEVVTWRAHLDPSAIKATPDHTGSIGPRVRSMLGLPPTSNPTSPGAALLEALDPCTSQARRWSSLVELGAMGTLLLVDGDAGPSFVLPRLRTTAGVLLDLATVVAPARHIAERWSMQLWPADYAGFDRRSHLASCALRHSIEAAMLALSLYPSIPTPVLNQATMLPLTLLSDGRWADGRLRPEAADTVLSELAELTPAAWSSLAAAAPQRHPDDVDLRFARALLLGRGLRLHRPADVSHVIPASIDADQRQAVAEAICDAIACRASLAVADDLVSALLAARDLYLDAGQPPPQRG